MNYPIRKIDSIRNTIKTKRFLNPLVENPKYLLIEVPNLTSKKTLAFRKGTRNANFVLKMTLKRLVYKLFLGDRQKNQKTPFKHNLYQLVCREDSQYESLPKLLRSYNAKVVSLISNHVMVENYEAYIISGFSKERLVAIIVKMLLFPPLVILGHRINKLRCNK